MPSSAAAVKEYLSDLPPERRKVVKTLLDLVRKAVPGASESIQYKMPTFEIDGQILCSVASQKNYFAVYVCETGALDKHRKSFAHLDVGKGCIRFKSLDDLPLDATRACLKDAARAVKAAK